MFRTLIVILIIAGIFGYFKFFRSDNKTSFPQFPSNLSEIDFNSVKDWSLNAMGKYLPDSTQSAVLGAKVKNESVSLIIEAAKRLKPEEYKTLQQFICEPN